MPDWEDFVLRDDRLTVSDNSSDHFVEFDRYGRIHPRDRQDHGPGAGWVTPGSSWNKTKQEAPYSYGAFYHWRSPGSEKDECAYNDRLRQWNSEAWTAACTKLPPGHFQYQVHAALDTLMSEYLSKPVRVTALAEGCNVSNGYPYYIFWWRTEPPQDAVAALREGE